LIVLRKKVSLSGKDAATIIHFGERSIFDVFEVYLGKKLCTVSKAVIGGGKSKM